MQLLHIFSVFLSSLSDGCFRDFYHHCITLGTAVTSVSENVNQVLNLSIPPIWLIIQGRFWVGSVDAGKMPRPILRSSPWTTLCLAAWWSRASLNWSGQDDVSILRVSLLLPGETRCKLNVEEEAVMRVSLQKRPHILPLLSVHSWAVTWEHCLLPCTLSLSSRDGILKGGDDAVTRISLQKWGSLCDSSLLTVYIGQTWGPRHQSIVHVWQNLGGRLRPLLSYLSSRWLDNGLSCCW